MEVARGGTRRNDRGGDRRDDDRFGRGGDRFDRGGAFRRNSSVWKQCAVERLTLGSVFMLVDEAAARGNPPQRTDFRVRVTDLPRGVDWRNVKDFLRGGGEVTYCNVENDGSAYVWLSALPD